jgi:Ca2+-binding EF-hand superfamily protein
MFQRCDKTYLGRAAFLFLLAVLSACAPSQHRNQQNSKLGPTYMLYSPNGEPLNGGPLGRPTCEEALSIWFGRVDIDHSGGISHAEFMADATSQFARMDIDKNGYLLPEELERYRLPYRQDTSSVSGNSQSSDAGSSGGQHRRSRHATSDDSGSSHASGKPYQNTAPDPVMSADTNNHFKVTLQDYIAQADRKFAELDADHDGNLSPDELLRTCKTKE